jgi:hypothetical protein
VFYVIIDVLVLLLASPKLWSLSAKEPRIGIVLMVLSFRSVVVAPEIAGGLLVHVSLRSEDFVWNWPRAKLAANIGISVDLIFMSLTIIVPQLWKSVVLSGQDSGDTVSERSSGSMTVDSRKFELE